MNIFIGLAILGCLLLSEVDSSSSPISVWPTLFGVGCLMLFVPGLALVQTMILNRRFQQDSIEETARDVAIRRLSICHTAVWLCASLAIVQGLKWHEIVRANWGLGQWLFIDEALILLPIVFSLLASWAVFYDIQETAPARFWDPERFQFVALKAQVCLSIVFLPVMAHALLKDLAPSIERLPAGWQATVVVGFCAACVGLFPLAIIAVWKLNPIDAELKRNLETQLQQDRIRFSEIRVWDTGSRVINAMVVGTLFRFRYLILSDGLVAGFPNRELMAVVRHEAAHVKLLHLPFRIAFVLMPLVSYALADQWWEGTPIQLLGGLFEVEAEFFANVIVGLDAAIYALLVFIGLCWLSKRMEFEADYYSCLAPQVGGLSICNEQVSAMRDALLRLVAFCPSQHSQGSCFHPSIERRLRRLNRMSGMPDSGQDFQFQRRRFPEFLVLALLCAAPFAI